MDTIGAMARRAESSASPNRLFLIAAVLAIAASAAPTVRRRLLVPTQAGDLAKELAAGKLLVARRSLQDPNFAETVILLVEHSEDEGTVGLILNRQTKIPLSRLSKEIEGAKGRTEPLYLGGPVQTEGVMALVRSRAKLEEAKHVLADIYMISSKATLEKTISANSASNSLRLYLGYAGWDAGQLEWELGMDSWDVLPATAAVVFDAHPETLWSRMVEQGELQMARSTRILPATLTNIL
jgi:putative transcriptional regulator